jgi:hypothetical protein
MKRGCGLGLWHTSSARKNSTGSKPRQRVGRGPKKAEAFLKTEENKIKGGGEEENSGYKIRGSALSHLPNYF